MSFLQYPEAMNTSDLQIWNNAAFDNGESEDSAPPSIRGSWSSVKPIFVNLSESLDSASSKENKSPTFDQTPTIPTKSQPLPLLSVKPLHPNGAVVVNQQQTKQIKKVPNSKLGLDDKPVSCGDEVVVQEKKIDAEIEEIEKEIIRLSSRLEVLRLQKLEQNVKMVEKKGRVIPAKFLEQKPSCNFTDGVKKIESFSGSSATKINRRGLSLGPSEILAGVRKGASLGPSEIAAGALKSRQLGKQEVMVTPVQSIQNRRKSCFWKLQDIEEEKVVAKSSSLSPKSRKAHLKTTAAQVSRQAVTTVGSRMVVKKEYGVLSSIQPKKLFVRDGEKSVPAKKPLKPGRVVASRYNQSAVQTAGNVSAMRKRSLPDNDKDESKRCDKKRASSVGKSRETVREQGTESRVKKRWEIPSEVVVQRAVEAENSPPTLTVMRDMLPKIRTAQYTIDTPRDSGPAKRVADLVGRKSIFTSDEEVEPSVCQVLCFAEDNEEQ